MGFQTVKITKKKYFKKSNGQLKKFIIASILGLCALGILGIAMIYVNYIIPLPNIDKLEKLDIKEASVIYDRDGNELYTLFGDEKRTYIDYSKISKNMINAIVSGEDKTFFENPGIDFKGLLRSVYNYVTGKSEKIEGTSTISQQLIKTVFLTNERKLERKIKEAYLSYKMTQSYTKEKILELYLNQISFGSNAFGIEQASRTFFGKPALNLDILQSSILASIPKGPTYYSPYNYYDRLVGNLYLYHDNDEKSKINLIKKSDLDTNKNIVNKYKTLISNLKATKLGDNGLLLCGINKDDYKQLISNIDKDNCSIIKYPDLLAFLNNIKINDGDISLEYQTGRKDFILGRMLEDNKITFDEYKKTLLDSIGFEFNEYVGNIKYPHFVFYIKDYLTTKYGEEILEEGGLKIYTTIDPKLQDKAQEIVKNQVEKNFKSFDANNGALISIDNKTGDIISFVGGADYYNKDIDGNNNMITAKRQPGSSFKPIVYALAIDKNPIGPHTPIYDLKTTFPGGRTPNNYNGKFEGKMTIMTALNHSRNIPAVKAYFLAGQQKAIIDYLKTTGVKSLNDNFSYGAPLAIGTGEMTPLELAGAYTVFANMGNKVEINPILIIKDSKGNIIEEKKQSAGTRVLDEKTAYIMNYILSADYSRPSDFWNVNLTLNNRVSCAKTGTSNKLFNTNGKKQILPGDLWTAGYTPQLTTVVWVGNTNGKEIKGNGDGLNGAAPIWKNFMEFALKNKEKLEWKKPNNLNWVKVSKISGLLAPEGFDPSFTVSSLFKNIPKKYDESLKQIQVDALCEGKVGTNTPPSAIKTGYLINFHSIDPNNKVWEAGVQQRVKEFGNKEFEGIPNIITNYTDTECERNQAQINNSNIKVSSTINENQFLIAGNNYIEISYNSINPLKKIQILIGDNIIQEITDVETQKSGIYKGSIIIPKGGYEGIYKLTIRALDSVYLAGEEVKNIKISTKDTFAPEINIINPTKDNTSIYSDQFFNLRGNVFDNSKLKSINIYIDDKPLLMGLEGKEFIQEINKNFDIPIGNHTLKIEAVDFYFNKSDKTIN
ncbi:MAG: transglycosylase domain-containing protein, partial [Candidatus Gracilibacteria bacterium]|nr:transglycosylase domain-containing protein [Candidatus Gracilibacteria bacterium]